MTSDLLKPEDLRKRKLKKVVIIISAIALITTIAIITLISFYPKESTDDGNGGS